jgi:hypothetical protein
MDKGTTASDQSSKQQHEPTTLPLHRQSLQPVQENNQLPVGGEQFSRFMLNYSPSYILQNKGATARDHLGKFF